MLAAKLSGDVESGKEITGIAESFGDEGVVVFHAGTKMKDGKLITSGGRVLTVAATNHHLSAACDRAYLRPRRSALKGSTTQGYR